MGLGRVEIRPNSLPGCARVESKLIPRGFGYLLVSSSLTGQTKTYPLFIRCYLYNLVRMELSVAETRVSLRVGIEPGQSPKGLARLFQAVDQTPRR